MGVRLSVAGMTLIVAVYLLVMGQQAITLLGSAEPVGIALGIGFLVIPLLAALGILAELRFGFRSARLTRMLEAEQALPEITVPTLPSGRADKQAAQELFDDFRAPVEAEPGRWQGWYRLGLVYDACGDRGRARRAVREAIRLERSGG